VKYLAIVALCFVVFFAAGEAPQADGTWFYVIQSMWSFGLLTAVLAIERSNLTICIASVELSAIFLNLLACVGYITSFEFFYHQYNVILNSLNIIEAVILLAGVKMNGIALGFPKLWRAPDNRGPSSRRFISVNPISITEEGRM